MSDDSDDFLRTRLEDMGNTESNGSPPREEAVPLKCWGRGGHRPPLSQLNLHRLIEITRKSDNFAKANATVNSGIEFRPVEKEDSIMKNIGSNCHEILGSPKTDRHIAEWLKQSFSEVVKHKKQINESLREPLYKSHSSMNAGNKLRTSDSEQSKASWTRIETDRHNDFLHMSSQSNGNVSYLPVQRTTDHKSSISSHHTLSSNIWSPEEKHYCDKTSSDVTYDEGSIRCIPNKGQTFTIENLPRNITPNEVKNVLESFGKVESIVTIENEESTAANVRMDADCDCSWIIECLNGTQPFGGHDS